MLSPCDTVAGTDPPLTRLQMNCLVDWGVQVARRLYPEMFALSDGVCTNASPDLRSSSTADDNDTTLAGTSASSAITATTELSVPL